MSDRDGIAVSIVSHRQGTLIGPLLTDLQRCPEVSNITVTHNLPESELVLSEAQRRVTRVLHNQRPRGFAANHNAAFAGCTQQYFCVLNPDVRLVDDPFPALLACFADDRVAVAGPAVVSLDGALEDSGRRFPTPLAILIKALGGPDGRYSFRLGDAPLHPDWIAGMFLLIDSNVFRKFGGFDDRFHLYYEDVDLSARLRRAGYDVVLTPRTHVVHDARRHSHVSLQYMAWHLRSMSRYFRKHLGRVPAGV